jgi:hypothetical protein
MTMATTATTWAACLFADGIVEQWVLIVKWLAVAAAAVIGGLLAGGAGKAAIRFLTTKTLNLWGVVGLRLGGAVAAGLLVYFLFPTGWGGRGGGSGDGTGTGQKDSRTVEKDPKKDKEKPKKTEPIKLPAGEPLRIEVLGPDALKLLKKDDVKPPPCYRLEGDEQKRLYNFKDLEDVLRQWHEKNPSLLVIILLYKDSPDEDRPLVTSLKDWLEERKIRVQVNKNLNDYSPEVRRNPP